VVGRSAILAAVIAMAHTGAARAQPGATAPDPLDDIRITFGPLTVGGLPAERDDRFSLRVQAGADARGDLAGAAAGGELGIGAELHRGTAECVRSIDLTGQVRGGAGDLPATQYSARAQACFAGWHILNELTLGADGNLLPPLSLSRGLRGLPLDRVTFGGGFAMLAVAMREGSFAIFPGHFEYEDLGQAPAGEPDAHFGNMQLQVAMFAVREAGESGGHIEFIDIGIREIESTALGPGAAAIEVAPLRIGGGLRGGWRIDGDVSLQVGQVRLDGDDASSRYLTLTTAGATAGIERRRADRVGTLRYRRAFAPAPREVILEDRVDASLAFARGAGRTGVRGFAAWTRAWTAPGGPQHRGLTGGGAIDWAHPLPHRSQLAVSAELARSYYAELGPAEPRPATGARLLVVLATELAGSR